MVFVYVFSSFLFVESDPLSGLHATGLFRVPGSKKRICQMRDEFDYGRDVHFSEDLNPTDVAGLLKAFLRDLPEPLLTKELYAPFIATRRMYEMHLIF